MTPCNSRSLNATSSHLRRPECSAFAARHISQSTQLQDATSLAAKSSSGSNPVAPISLDIVLSQLLSIEGLVKSSNLSRCPMATRQVGSARIRLGSHEMAPTAGYDPTAGAFSLQLDRLNFRHKPRRVGREERGHNLEHCVTEAADVQDVAAVRGLCGRVGLQINADQTRTVEVPAM